MIGNVDPKKLSPDELLQLMEDREYIERKEDGKFSCKYEPSREEHPFIRDFFYFLIRKQTLRRFLIALGVELE